MAPKVGLEPTTDRLTADCSTIELLWNPKSAQNVRPLPGRVKRLNRRIFSVLNDSETEDKRNDANLGVEAFAECS